MLQKEIFIKVRQIIASVLEIDPNQILPHSTLRENLGIESMNLLLIIGELQVEYDIDIPLRDLSPNGRHDIPLSLTVNNVCEYITGKLVKTS